MSHIATTREPHIPRLVMDEENRTNSPVLTIIKTTGDHIGELKKNLRVEDAQEILRFGVTIQHALWRSYRRALTCKTALIDGRVAAVWGLHGTFMGRTGQPFLMTTPEVQRVSPLRFTRIYQQEVLQMLKMFPRLENAVDAEYEAAIRLLEIIGFTVGKPEKMGNSMFERFWIEK